MSAKPSLLAELRRRNVLRAGALYMGAVWALGQGIAQLGPALYLPDWVTRWFLVAAALGFPFWLAFAWAFELTPAGVKREGEVVVDAATARRTARRLDHWTFGVLAVAIVLLLTDRFVVHSESVAVEAVTEQSVAVLPLANESGDSANDYFVDGLSEQLISDLSRLEALKVIGRTSSFRFRGSQESRAAIGAQLGVAHLIDGTVRQSGNRVKVVVGLVRAADGRSVWSQSYDREMKDIFAVQAEIAQAVAAALQAKLGSTSIASSDMPPSGNVEAYQALLKAVAIGRQYTEPALRQAIAHAETAIRIDPGYAYAHVSLSQMWYMLAGYQSGAERRQAYTEMRRHADLALALAPDLPAAHLARGAVLIALDFDHVGAQAEFSRALELAPGDASAMHGMAQQLAIVGELEQAVYLMRKAIAAEPLVAGRYNVFSVVLAALGRLDEAEQAMRNALALQPDFPHLYAQLSLIAVLRGDAAAALHHAEQEFRPESREYALAMARQIAGDRQVADAALQAYIARYGETDAYDIAQLYALRRQPDRMLEWLERAWTARDLNVAWLLADPFLRPYQHDPRFAALCKKMGLPVPGVE